MGDQIWTTRIGPRPPQYGLDAARFRKRSRSRGIAALQMANRSLLWRELVNQRGCAGGCALMRAQNVIRVLDKPLARFAVAEKLGKRVFERIDIAYLDRTIF